MKKTSRFAFAVALCALAGCVQMSLNPLYTEKDLAFDPALLGTWQGVWRGGIFTNDTNGILTTWNFTKGDGDKEYKLFFTDEEGKTAQFFVRRLKLGEALFLDFLPADPDDLETNRSFYYDRHFIPMHSFARLLSVESGLQVSLFSGAWLEELLNKDPAAIRHERLDQERAGLIILTATTKELQSFVLKHLDDKDAFLQPINLKRKQAGPKKE
ncbi:MAG TPA: hypothetical protein VN887_17265 [Candidatus Angelobacter sp.]|nr:hypothetical protein [Candidatus Angelobacter sp.]